MDEFKKLVEEKSSRHQTWGYMGSDSYYHYFRRSTLRMFTGLYKHVKISKDAYFNFPTDEEKAISDNSGVIASVFTLKDENRDGYIHSLDFGFNETPFKSQIIYIEHGQN